MDSSALVIKGEVVHYYDNGRFSRLASFRSAINLTNVRTVQAHVPEYDEDDVLAGPLSITLPDHQVLDGTTILENRRRYLLILGDADSLEFFSTAAGTTVSLTLPFNGLMYMELPNTYKRVGIKGSGEQVTVIVGYESIPVTST